MEDIPAIIALRGPIFFCLFSSTRNLSHATLSRRVLLPCQPNVFNFGAVKQQITDWRQYTTPLKNRFTHDPCICTVEPL